MTEDEVRLARAQRDLMDVVLRRFSQLEEGLRSAGISVPSLDQHGIDVIRRWMAAREAERQAESEDARR